MIQFMPINITDYSMKASSKYLENGCLILFCIIVTTPFFYPITNFKFSTILQKLFNKRNTQIEGGKDRL